MKLHIVLSADGYLPEFVDMTAGRVHEIKSARELRLPRGSCVVFDRGYTDYRWYREVTEAGVHFVTRLKRNAAVRDGEKRRGRKSPGVLEDRLIELLGVEGRFRKIRFLDEAGGEEYEFLTNADDLPAGTVAALYRERPQVELFFQVDQAAPEGEEFCGHERERGTDATLDRAVRVSVGVVPQISQPLGTVNLAEFAAYAAQFV